MIFEEFFKNSRFEAPCAGYRAAPFLAHSNRYYRVASEYFLILFSVMDS
jgi:hypothetical protein